MVVIVSYEYAFSQNRPKPLLFRSHNHLVKPPSPPKPPNNRNRVAVSEGGGVNEGYGVGSQWLLRKRKGDSVSIWKELCVFLK